MQPKVRNFVWKVKVAENCLLTRVKLTDKEMHDGTKQVINRIVYNHNAGDTYPFQKRLKKTSHTLLSPFLRYSKQC